jgi:hypothetical protein
VSKGAGLNAIAREGDPMADGETKGWFRAFWDFFVLFSGISTASNLARAQGRQLRTRGVFLFRKPQDK